MHLCERRGKSRDDVNDPTAVGFQSPSFSLSTPFPSFSYGYCLVTLDITRRPSGSNCVLLFLLSFFFLLTINHHYSNRRVNPVFVFLIPSWNDSEFAKTVLRQRKVASAKFRTWTGLSGSPVRFHLSRSRCNEHLCNRHLGRLGDDRRRSLVVIAAQSRAATL